MKKLDSILLMLTPFLFSACAYHFTALKRHLPGGYDRVAVPMFKNKSFETGIESYFTAAMIEELERDHFAKVTSRDDAQVILEGNIGSVNYGAGAQVDDPALVTRDVVLSKEYRIYVSANLKLIRVSDQKILWSGGFSGEKQYPAPQMTIEGLDTSNATYNHSARMDNIKLLARDMMIQAHINMTENF